MIPKIICWLFGHKRREKYCMSDMKTFDWINPLTGITEKIPVKFWKFLDRCPRCGEPLKSGDGRNYDQKTK